ncbi:formate/nitrite transporter family protein [Selenomonas sp. AE3005]|uniref:formate/nitrite transporter family protein n=1 Tax=Selenomonas sp. AE3005 TaxID=1485543 RepID=UPI0025FAE262|nr:formate/nitrite transporter family protein [Selenomonas sp. AE3005]
MNDNDFVHNLPKIEQHVLATHAPMPPQLIFKIIRKEGEEELVRSFRALAFSGLAAGIFVSFSFLFRSIFHMHMGDSPLEPLVSSIGYTTGFLIVILGRMQLFTENPITTIVPLLSEWSITRLLKVLRLWGTVFLFNIIGTSIAAAFFASPYTLSPHVEAAMHEVAANVMTLLPIENILRGIPAGILIAAIVWISPQTKYFRFMMIMFFVYFIALGDFSHVVVGSCEMAYEVIKGNADFFTYFFKFLIPTGLGNIIGGTMIFTLLIYNQVLKELR